MKCSNQSRSNAACEQNTYKASNGTCVSCPPHTSTTGPGTHQVKGCKCDPGYTGPDGGPCQGSGILNTTVSIYSNVLYMMFYRC